MLSTEKADKMEEMASFWSYQESIDELKFKIHHTSLELEAVKAKAKEEMNINTDSLKQLIQLLKLVLHERDEARDQIQKLLIKIMPSINNTMITNYFMTDQVHQHYQKANSSIAESNSLSDAYNHSSSPVDSLFDPVSSPDQFSYINTNNSFVQDYRHELTLSNRFQALGSVAVIDHATLMMDSMIKRKALPQKGNLLLAVMEAGPLLQTLLVANPLPGCQNLSPLQSLISIPPVSLSEFSSYDCWWWWW